MTRLTRKEQRLLRRIGDAVRIYIACISLLCPILCVGFANAKYGRVRGGAGAPEIAPVATYGTIMGIYLPVFAAVAAYVWATRAGPTRNLAPRGFAMALFRDAFTIVVVSVALSIPVLLYWTTKLSILDANPYLTWYQTIMTAMAGGAFTYYFHANIAPTPAAEADDEAPTPRTRPEPEPARAAARSPARDAAPRPRRPRRTPGKGGLGGGGAEEA